MTGRFPGEAVTEEAHAKVFLLRCFVNLFIKNAAREAEALLGIHPVHRRLAELTMKVRVEGGYQHLSESEKREMEHCLAVNLDLVYRLDCLKSIAFVAYESGDVDWQMELCAQIERLESKWL